MAASLTDPLTPRSIHLCVDMQRLFSAEGPWPTPWMDRVLPLIAEVVRWQPENTVFTRFIPPQRPSDMPGRWARYYRRWHNVTGDELDSALLTLVEPLPALAPAATIVDKRVYSPFFYANLTTVLRQRECDCVVITGAETDVCVLATVLGAIDHGYRVVLVEDAVCSSSDAGHDALMTMYRERFTEQVEIAPAEQVLARWPRVP